MISTVIYLIGKVLTFPGAYIKAFFEHLIASSLYIINDDFLLTIRIKYNRL